MLFNRWIPVVSSVVALAALAACSPKRVTPVPPPPCPGCISSGAGMGADAAAGSGGGSSSGVGAGGQGGDTATAVGDVVDVNSAAFDLASAHAKPAVVYADGPAGKQLAGDYDGTTFTIDGVADGSTWFLVAPKDSSDTVFPTYSRQQIPAAKLVLPVIDQQVMQGIGLEAGLALSTLQAQIVLRVTNGTKPLAGVSAASAGAGLVLYDLGSASYSAQSTSTGERGVIVLLNQAATTITLTDANAHTYSVDVRPSAGSATILDLALQ